ncbi:uncharacterized protein [Primulina eburnea]|uniref:uncharacterized protein isoform X1 n=1 Tax=Primulina eburnea TaxID=1245227 RepID=UPI003C6C09AD
MDSHGVKIDSCTPGLYDLLVCPKINTTGRHGSLLKFFYGFHWILSSLGVASRPKFSSQDAVQRLTIYAEKSDISCWPKLVYWLLNFSRLLQTRKNLIPVAIFMEKSILICHRQRKVLSLEVLDEEVTNLSN